jgi:adenosylmethionine-8-amino-7-oxononanoate aminotransferase
MNQRGLYTRVRGDVICLAPPLVTTAAQIDRIVEIVREVIPAVVQGA